MSASNSPVLAPSPLSIQSPSRDSPTKSRSSLEPSQQQQQQQQRGAGVIHRPFEDNERGVASAAASARPAAEQYSAPSPNETSNQRHPATSAFDCQPKDADATADSRRHHGPPGSAAVDVNELIRRQFNSLHRHHYPGLHPDVQPPTMPPAHCMSSTSTHQFFFQQAQQHLQQLLLQQHQQQLLQHHGSGVRGDVGYVVGSGVRSSVLPSGLMPIPGAAESDRTTDASTRDNSNRMHDEELDVLDDDDDDIDELDSVGGSRGGGSPFSAGTRQANINDDIDDIGKQNGDDMRMDSSSSTTQQQHQQLSQRPHHKTSQSCKTRYASVSKLNRINTFFVAYVGL
jgi:hypothetical protein